MLTFTMPWILCLLPLPILVRQYYPLYHPKPSHALWIPFFESIQHHASSQPFPKNTLSWFGFAWLNMIIALAGPQYLDEIKPSFRQSHSIFMALDLSGSMMLDDMIVQHRRYTRLAIVKYAAESFIQQRTSDPIGLILFGTRAYLQTPLTYDHAHLIDRLHDATVGLAGPATAIGDAIGLAVKHLQNTPPKGRILVLLTDGMNNNGVLSPEKATEIAKKEKIKIYTIGLSAKDPSFLPFSNMPQTSLDEDSLKRIAQETGGRYFKATDLKALQAIYQAIHNIETEPESVPPYRPYQEGYPWPLSVAILSLIIGVFHACSLSSWKRSS